MDPYANAISDVYQDIFGEGIFGRAYMTQRFFMDSERCHT